MKSVDPNNYQVSLRYKKSEIITMKFLLLFMFVAVALAKQAENVSERKMAEGFAGAFNISLADAFECVKKYGVTTDDLAYLEHSMDASESEITDMQSLTTASCAIVCVSQKQGTYLGKDVDLDEVSNYLESTGMPEDISDKLRDCARVCKEQVLNENDECMAGYKFIKCMYQRSRAFLDKD